MYIILVRPTGEQQTVLQRAYHRPKFKEALEKMTRHTFILTAAIFGLFLPVSQAAEPATGQTVLMDDPEKPAATPSSHEATEVRQVIFKAGDTRAQPVEAVSQKSVDLPNTHKVHEFLYRGGEPTKDGLEKLKQMNVKTVFDLRNPGEKKIPEADICKKLGMTYVPLPMSSEPPKPEQVKRIMSAIKKSRENPEAGKVMVHCAHGSDRTGCIIGIYRVTEDGYSYDEAYKEMRRYWFTPKFVKLSGAVKQYAQNNSSTK